MTLQRRRGQAIQYWKTVAAPNRRGNIVKSAALDEGPFPAIAWVIPQRSSKAEVPGQQQIQVVRLGVDADLPDLDLWSRVLYSGQLWDVAAPPEYHHGTRHTRHMTIDLRKRPEVAT